MSIGIIPPAAAAAVGERVGERKKKNPRCQIFHVICPATNQRECLEEECRALSSPPGDGWMDSTAVHIPVARGGEKKTTFPAPRSERQGFSRNVF